MTKFQIILLCVFGFFILVAVAVFALYRGGASSTQARVVIWGDIPSQDINTLLNSAPFSSDTSLTLSYVERPASTLERDFTEALASGSGPDLIILSQDQFWKNRSKLIPIPYQSLSERTFKDTFVEAGEIYLASDGVYGLPLSVDPLVLYYNRDLISEAGLAKPISYWDELYKQTLDLSQRDQAGNLTQSAIALGETKNIKNSKDILSLLMIQAGNPIVGSLGGRTASYLNQFLDAPVLPAVSAVDFYTQFSNPTKAYYSWNRTLPEAQSRFASGDLVYYLGFASELRTLRSKNPTLNFAVAPVPQSRVSGRTLTVASVRAVSLSRGSRNPSAALTAAFRLVSAESSAVIWSTMWLAPARRDLLSQRPTDAVFPVFFGGALQARSWLDPDAVSSEKIFADMIDTVTSGRARTTEAVSKANDQLDALIK